MANKKGFGYSFSLDIKDFEKACKNVQKLMDKTFGNNIMRMSNTAVKALGAISAAMAGIGAAAFAMGRKLDAALTGLQGIWGSAKDAADQYERLKLIAESSTFGIDSLTAVDKKISALGLSATESASLIVRLGNTVTATNGTAQNLEQMAEALLRIKTTGEVSTRSLMAFAEAGIKVDDLIGGDATNAINTLIDRMQKFNGYMQGESTDIWTQYDRSVKIAQDALAKLGNYINDNFKEYVVVVVDKISQLRDKFVELLNDKDGLHAVYNVFKRIAQAITVLALPALLRLAVGFTPIIVQATAVTVAIGGIALAIEDLSGENSLIVSGLTNLGNRFKWLAAKTIEFFDDAFVSIANLGIDAFNFIFKSIEKLFNKFFFEFDEKIKAFIGELAYAADLLGQSKLADKLYSLYVDRGIFEIKVPLIPKLEATPDDGNRLSDQIALEAEENDKKLEEAMSNFMDRMDSFKEGIKGVYDFFTIPPEIADDTKSKIAEIEAAAISKIEATKKTFTQAIDESKAKMDERKQTINEWLDESLKGLRNQLNNFEKFSDIINQAAWSGENFFKSMGKGLRDLGDSILKQITKLLILRSLFRMFGISSGSAANLFGLPEIKTVNDGIVQNGKVITTHPDDYIIATKTPETLGNGKANVVVNVHNNSSVPVQAEANSYFDGTRTVIDLFLNGYSKNINGIQDMLRRH